jgi:hypothetical protein
MEAREQSQPGVAVTFDHDVAQTAELARLPAAEYSCCSFASYHLTIDGRGVRLEVHAPPEAAPAGVTVGHGNGLRTGEVAGQAGVNVQTMRYYERRGLIAEPVIGVIKAAQRLGFTLDEITGRKRGFESGCGGGFPSAVTFKYPVRRGARDRKQVGEVGNRVVASGVHASQFGLLLGGQLRLPPAQFALRAGDGHAGYRAGEPVEFRDYERVVFADGGQGLVKAGAFPGGAGQSVVEVDPLVTHAEFAKSVTLGGEVLFVGGAARNRPRFRTWSECNGYRGLTENQLVPPM